MARLTKQTDRWFEVPDDPDGAKLRIKHLKPGEWREIEAAANPAVGRMSAGGMDVEVEVNPHKRQSLLVQAALVDWQGFLDSKGKPLACTDGNKAKALIEFAWLGPMVAEAVAELKAEIEGQEEDAEKN